MPDGLFAPPRPQDPDPEDQTPVRDLRDPFGPNATHEDVLRRLSLLEDHCYGRGIRPALPDNDKE